ncbi:hypothetical protein [Alkalihalobacterium alkalinitrilicum]|uniref:hypothetical protein n=1 Tax=Alkalihalobacterium alkalinitrilicum TaxID=427920 RepID=UPI000994C873|nr:hypothetical protein [Alkalihalobacterium alkalinitrilicum]
MAHLIKLEDYISRYQMDMQRYPTQYTRMKKERWYYLKNEWEQLKATEMSPHMDQDELLSHEHEKTFNMWMSAVQKFKSWSLLGKRKKQEEIPISQTVEEEKDQLTLKARNVNHLRELFLDDLFLSQLMWASSSILEQSYLNPKYKYDEQLRFFTQQLPDNYLLMYAPVFWIKQAPVDMDIILITPSEVQCITKLEGKEHSIFQASSDRFWVELVGKSERKVLSPVVSLNRMASLISEIMQENNCEFPIKKTVLAKDCLVDNIAQGLKVEIIDKRSFARWHERQRRHPSPIKSQQLKIAKILLDHCHISAHIRQIVKDID